jgi:hypothetical protein
VHFLVLGYDPTMANSRDQQKLLNAIESHKKGVISSFTLNRAIQDYQAATQQKNLQNFHREGGVGKYGLKASASRAIARATKGMGKIGAVLQGIFTGKESGFQASQIAAAAELIREYQSNQAAEKLPELAQRAVDALEGNGWSLSDAHASMKAEAGSRQRSIETPPDSESDYQSGHRIGRRNNSDEEPRMSKKILKPNSSNVHSFQYDYLTSTLYVSYLAPDINKKAVTNYISAGGLPAIAGDLGKTVGGKDRSASPYTYAYFDVPIKVYKAMVKAASAGGTVWDNLRVRGAGNIHESNYRYTLVSGAVVAGAQGDPAIYVPRKATSKGFTSRSVAQPGQGRRQYVSSTLPQDHRGHGRSMTRGRSSRPNRGK